MAMSDRLLAAWYQGHPALKLLQPLEWLVPLLAFFSFVLVLRMSSLAQ